MRVRKLQEAIWLTEVNEIFELLVQLGHFFRIDLFFEYSWGYQSNVVNYQKVILLTVFNEMPDFTYKIKSLFHMNYYFTISWCSSIGAMWKQRTWASFHTSAEGFRKLQKAIEITVLKEVVKFFQIIHSGFLNERLVWSF